MLSLLWSATGHHTSFLHSGSVAPNGISSDADSDMPWLTTAKPSSSSASAARDPVLQRDANRLQSRFATEKIQHFSNTVLPLPPAAQPADRSQQPSSSSGSASMQQPLQQAQHTPQVKVAGAQAGLSATSSLMGQPDDQDHAASTSGRTSPGNLQLPFGQLPSALAPGLLQTAVSSGPASTQRQQPGLARIANDVPASVQSLQRLSLKDRANILRSGSVRKGSMPCQVSAHTSIDSPEKQELGRRECLLTFVGA